MPDVRRYIYRRHSDAVTSYVASPALSFYKKERIMRDTYMQFSTSFAVIMEERLSPIPVSQEDCGARSV